MRKDEEEKKEKGMGEERKIRKREKIWEKKERGWEEKARRKIEDVCEEAQEENVQEGTFSLIVKTEFERMAKKA